MAAPRRVLSPEDGSFEGRRHLATQPLARHTTGVPRFRFGPAPVWPPSAPTVSYASLSGRAPAFPLHATRQPAVRSQADHQRTYAQVSFGEQQGKEQAR